MNPNDVLPILRPVEVIPLGEDENESFLLRDPQRLADHMITISRPVLFCLQYFDGETQAATLAELWRQISEGHELPMDQLEQVIAELDRVYLLDNPNSQAREAAVRAEFQALAVRPHRFGDAVEEVAAVLNRGYEAAGLPVPAAIANEGDDLAGLVAPHIDYLRGSAAWGKAYALAKRRFAGDVVVVLGTNHQSHGHPLALTRKHYDTPFGEVRTAIDLVDELAAALPFDAFADEFCHRDEHSIELAAVALKHAFGDRCPAIVPVICGSLDGFVQQKLHPANVEFVSAFHQALRRIIDREGKRVLVLTSVDFAHIGPQFGAAEPIEDAVLETSLARDRRLLELIGEGRAEELFNAIIAEENERNVCGVAPLYHALQCLPEVEGREPSLHCWKAEDGSGAVSFAVLGLMRKEATPR